MKLQDILTEAAQKYYSSGSSEMTDAEFDAKLAELKEADPNNPIITAVGHGYSVDSDDTPGEKVKHKYGVAGSLVKCHNWKEFNDKLTCKDDCFASIKLDGMSVVLYYKEGELVRALTRGDGTIGIDITDKVRIFKPAYFHLTDTLFTGAVRGEIIMSYEEFGKFKTIKPDAKNPRNSTVGLINSKYTKDDDFKYLNIVVYTVIGNEADGFLPTYQTMHAWLTANFDSVAHVANLGECMESTFEAAMKECRREWYGEYPADGVVLTDNVLTRSGFEVVYDAVAYKFNDETGVSEVEEVEWNLSKTKYLVPRIKVKTIQLSGTDVTWIHGDNAKNILDNGIAPGAQLELIKAGEIIPDIVRIISRAEVTLPSNCPCCKEPLSWKGVHLVCANPECADSQMQDLLIWTQFIAPTDNLGDALKIKFFSELGIESVDDLYLTEVPADSAKGIQYDTFVQMCDDALSKPVSLVNVIRALNIPRFGEVTSKKLAAHPDAVLHLIDSFDPLPETYAVSLGAANFRALVENSAKFTRLQYIRDNIVWKEPPDMSDGKEIVVTGKLSVKRTAFESELNAHGYVLTDTVKASTFVLVTDDPNSASSKNAKAAKLGIRKLTEAQFREEYLK